MYRGDIAPVNILLGTNLDARLIHGSAVKRKCAPFVRLHIWRRGYFETSDWRMNG